MKNHSIPEETRKDIAYCLRLFAQNPSLVKEYNEHKPEWNDEKAFNEAACRIVRLLEQ